MELNVENQGIAVAVDECFQDHVAQGFHPERPERLVAARRGLDGALSRQSVVDSRLASTGELVRVHSPAYIDLLERSLRRGHGFLDGDTFFSPGSHEAAWRAAGSACALVEALLEPEGPSAGILLARPPGHHASRDRAMGFCLVNSIAVAAAHARGRGTERVAIVDWDVHHGNGTQDIFERDPDVLFISLHQWPLYPGTGSAREIGLGDGRGRTLNVPLPPGAGAAAYRAAFERVVAPALEAFAPGLVLVSAGFDAHERDPLAAMRVDTETFGWMGGQVGAAARAVGHGRVGVLLEGGYDLRALEESVTATVDGITGMAHASGTHARSPAGEEVDRALRSVIEAHRPFWRAGTF